MDMVWIEEEAWGLRAIPLQAAIPIKPTAIAGPMVPIAITKADESIFIFLRLILLTRPLFKVFYLSAFNENQRKSREDEGLDKSYKQLQSHKGQRDDVGNQKGDNNEQYLSG